MGTVLFAQTLIYERQQILHFKTKNQKKPNSKNQIPVQAKKTKYTLKNQNCLITKNQTLKNQILQTTNPNQLNFCTNFFSSSRRSSSTLLEKTPPNATQAGCSSYVFKTKTVDSRQLAIQLIPFNFLQTAY